MKTLTTALLILISATTFAQEDTIQIDTTPYTKWAVVKIDEYCEFSYEISQEKSYELGMKTERVYPPLPQQFCFVDSVLFVTVPIVPSNQPYYKHKLFDVTEINFKDTILEEIDVILDEQVAVWFNKHYIANGDTTKILKIKNK